MPDTSPRSSCDSPLASDSPRSISSCRRRTCASTSSDRTTTSGIGTTRARTLSPVFVTSSLFARVRPSTMM